MPTAKSYTQSGRDNEILNGQAQIAAASDRWRFGGFQVSLIRGVSPTRERLERELKQAGYKLPLPHRVSWVAAQRRPADHWMLFVQDTAGRPCGAVGVLVSPSRALPGHRLLRVERFGPGVQAAAYAATIQALVAMARRDPRVLRLYIESFASEPNVRMALESILDTAGFVRVPSPRCYEHTLVLALDKDEDALLGSFTTTARQNIRSTRKYGVHVAPITDPAHFDRLNELGAETYERNGGRFVPEDWARILAVGAAEEGASRVVGLFRNDPKGPEDLLAFAWACGHGEHTHYCQSGSTRKTDRRIPLLYPLLWDLILWAKRSGARYFDFGGITPGTHDGGEPLGGISDFKRYFTKTMVQVGAEWAYEPRPKRAQVAKWMKSAVSLASGVFSGIIIGG